MKTIRVIILSIVVLSFISMLWSTAKTENCNLDRLLVNQSQISQNIMQKYFQKANRTIGLISTTLDDWNNNAWELNQIDSLKYNAQGKIIEMVSYEYDEGDYDLTKTVITYANDRITQAVIMMYNAGMWIPMMTTTFTYNATGNIVKTVVTLSYGAVSLPMSRIHFIYSGDNRLDYYLMAMYSMSTNLWSYNKASFDYDGNGRPISSLSETSSDSLAWTNYEQSSTTYSPLDNSSYADFQYFLNNSMLVEIPNGDPTAATLKFGQTLTQSWSENAWINSERETYTYDGSSRISYILKENWNGSGWVNYEDETYTYNNDGKLDVYLTRYWTEQWQNRQKETYAYGEIISNTDPSVPDKVLRISTYPNPFIDQTTVTLESKSIQTARISIYNVKGQLIRNMGDYPIAKGVNEFYWDGKDMLNREVSQGIFFIRLETGKSSIVHKVVKIR